MVEGILEIRRAKMIIKIIFGVILLFSYMLGISLCRIASQTSRWEEKTGRYDV